MVESIDMDMFNEQPPKELIYYHGSYCEIKVPVLTKSRKRVDFGVGFYLTTDINVADKWAASKNPSYRNVYKLDLSGLAVYTFEDDEAWFDFVVANRMGDKVDPKFAKYDVLIGKIVDDKMFSAIEDYTAQILSKEQALQIVSAMDYGLQYVLKTEKALKKIKFIKSRHIYGTELQNLKEQFKEDTIQGSHLYYNLKTKMLGGTYYVPNRDK